MQWLQAGVDRICAVSNALSDSNERNRLKTILGDQSIESASAPLFAEGKSLCVRALSFFLLLV